MTRFLPRPWLSLAVLIAWLMLNGTVTAGQVVLGALLSWAIPMFARSRCSSRPLGMRRAWTALRLVGVVLYDIVVSSLVVAWQVVARTSSLQSRLVCVPLQLRTDAGIAMLGSIITMTPGTLTAGVSADRAHLVVHALHATDDADLLRSIKERYERPLLEICG